MIKRVDKQKLSKNKINFVLNKIHFSEVWLESDNCFNKKIDLIKLGWDTTHGKLSRVTLFIPISRVNNYWVNIKKKKNVTFNINIHFWID